MPDGAPANCSSPQPVDDPIVAVGHPSVVTFPGLCVNCAQPALPWFHYQQAFPRFGDEGQLVGHEVYGTRIPLARRASTPSIDWRLR